MFMKKGKCKSPNAINFGTLNENIYLPSPIIIHGVQQAVWRVFSSERLLHSSSCRPINNRNFITPSALMPGMRQCERWWAFSYVNANNLLWDDLTTSPLKDTLSPNIVYYYYFFRINVPGYRTWHCNNRNLLKSAFFCQLWSYLRCHCGSVI